MLSKVGIRSVIFENNLAVIVLMKKVKSYLYCHFKDTVYNIFV